MPTKNVKVKHTTENKAIARDKTPLPKITHRFVISDARWIHGTHKEIASDSALRIKNGKMCCLGFFAQSCGVKAANLLNLAEPWSIAKEDRTPKLDTLVFTFDTKGFLGQPEYANPQVIHDLIDLNDGGGWTLPQRKKGIKKLFRQMGVGVTFTSDKKRSPDG